MSTEAIRFAAAIIAAVGLVLMLISRASSFVLPYSTKKVLDEALNMHAMTTNQP